MKQATDNRNEQIRLTVAEIKANIVQGIEENLQSLFASLVGFAKEEIPFDLKKRLNAILELRDGIICYKSRLWQFDENSLENLSILDDSTIIEFDSSKKVNPVNTFLTRLKEEDRIMPPHQHPSLPPSLSGIVREILLEWKQSDCSKEVIRSMEYQEKIELFSAITNRFSLIEVSKISTSLEIDFEKLKGKTLRDKTRELILHCYRRGWITQLIINCRQQYPDFRWIGEQSGMESVTVSSEITPLQLEAALNKHFDENDLRQVGFLADIQYESLIGSKVKDKIAALVEYAIHNNKFETCVQACIFINLAIVV